MPVQFTTRTLILVTVFVAIATAGVLGLTAYAARHFPGPSPSWNLAFLVFGGPIYIPVAFAAYAVGRRKITARAIVALAVAEAAPFVALYYL